MMDIIVEKRFHNRRDIIKIEKIWSIIKGQLIAGFIVLFYIALKIAL